MTSLAIHVLQGDALRIEQFFKHASCPPTPQFEDLNHINVDATDETKIVTTKFVLGFCLGQLRFCLLVRISPNIGSSWQQSSLKCFSFSGLKRNFVTHCSTSLWHQIFLVKTFWTSHVFHLSCSAVNSTLCLTILACLTLRPNTLHCGNSEIIQICRTTCICQVWLISKYWVLQPNLLFTISLEPWLWVKSWPINYNLHSYLFLSCTLKQVILLLPSTFKIQLATQKQLFQVLDSLDLLQICEIKSSY